MQKIIEEKPFPNSLEDRLASVANAINTELKIATLLHLDDTPQEASEIKARIRETIGEGYLPNVKVFNEYGNTLYDIALVAKGTITRDIGKVESVSYRLTEAGKMYGLPAAVMSLRYAVNNNLSMFQILGSTASRGESRSPYNRMKILYELRNSEEMREDDLAKISGLNNSVIQLHLEALAKIGFVVFDSVGAKSKGKFTYEWIKGKSPDEAKTISEQVCLTRRIAEYLSQHDASVDRNTLYEMLGYGNPRTISLVLSGLEKQGLVRRTSPWRSKGVRSITRILDKGREFHDEFYFPFIELLLDNSIENFQENVKTFRISNQFSDYLRKGIEFYRSISSQINRKSSRERKEEIKHLLISNQGLTSREIAETLNISSAWVRCYISKLDGVRQKKDDHEVRYFIDNE